jgi:hypothetical protein
MYNSVQRPRRMRLIDRRKEMRNAFETIIRKTQGKKELGKQNILSRILLKSS